MKHLQDSSFWGKFTNRQLLVIVFFIITLLLSQPYVITLLMGIKNDFLWIIPLVIVWLFSLSYKTRKFPPELIGCCALQILIWLVFWILHNDTSYITRIAFILLSLSLLSFVDRSVSISEITECHNRFIAAQCVLGAIAFIVVFMGVLSPLLEFSLHDSRPAYFFGITCTNSVNGRIIRPAGFFDEPGALAGWGVYALILNKVSSDNRKIELMLIISLLFTLSLAYYIQLVVYIILFYGNKIKSLIPLIVVVAVAFLLVSSNKSSDIYNLTVGRIVNLLEDGIESTSRGAMTEIAKGYFCQSPLIGVGARMTEKLGVYASDNPYETLGRDGILGTIALYLPLLFVIGKIRNKRIWAGIVVLGLGYLQRPFHMNILHYTMMYTYCILALRKTEQLKY